MPHLVLRNPIDIDGNHLIKNRQILDSKHQDYKFGLNQTKISIPSPHTQELLISFVSPSVLAARSHSRTFARLYFIMQMTPLIPGSLFALIFVREHIHIASRRIPFRIYLQISSSSSPRLHGLLCAPRADTLSRSRQRAPRLTEQGLNGLTLCAAISIRDCCARATRDT